jgi:ABC-2 type transport system ATP-binding protein
MHITIQDLCFSYQNTSVFQRVNLVFEKGFLYGILGKNGTGKSTLLYTLAGLLVPKSGAVNVNGFIPSLRQPQFLQDVFLVPEEFHLPDISIPEFVKVYSAFYPRFEEAVFYNYLQAFDIPSHTLLKMSYGQKKKALISFGLASGVSLLLMDEPTNGLDIISKSQFRKAIAAAVDNGRTILISSHQVQDLSQLIDHLVILDGTKVMLQQSLHTISEKLVFKISNDSEEISSAYYAEPVLGGHALVLPNHAGGETNVNLELLYKSIMTNAPAIQYALQE